MHQTTSPQIVRFDTKDVSAWHPGRASPHDRTSMSAISHRGDVTEHIEIIAAVKPGLRAPGVVAKMAAGIDQISGGRFALNLV